MTNRDLVVALINNIDLGAEAQIRIIVRGKVLNDVVFEKFVEISRVCSEGKIIIEDIEIKRQKWKTV